MSSSLEECQRFRDTVIGQLRLYDDQPEFHQSFFNYDPYVPRVVELLLNVPNKPFAICLDGEWGGGKTSLLRRIYDQLSKRQVKGLEVLWFDVWEYERMDPAAVLLQKIALLYGANSKTNKLKKIAIGMATVFARSATQNVLGIEYDDVRKAFHLTVKETENISQIIEDLVGDGTLYIFVDDLDRCYIENVVGILEAMKLMFSAKNVKFIVAADITKLERAWELKHKGYEGASVEAKAHLEKIFQLRLGLPPKDNESFKAYANLLASSLGERLIDLLVLGFPHNPRKLKRLLNLVYFMVHSMKVEGFSNNLPGVVIMAAAISNFQGLASAIKADPKIIAQLCRIIGKTPDFENLKGYYGQVVKLYPTGSANHYGIPVGPEDTSPTAIEFLKQCGTNPQLYAYVKAVALYYEFDKGENYLSEMINSMVNAVSAAGLLS